ncbi:MAG: hypothetical protein WCQ53_05270 [bacterium]
MTFEEENTSTILTEDGKLVVTQAYCHNGHDLISSESKISGYPSIKLLIIDEKNKKHDVYISAVDADHTRKGGDELKKDQVVTVACPVCEEELDNIAPCDCTKGSKFVAIYLNKKRSFTSCVGICNSWGCYRSFMNSVWRIISRLADNPTK